MNKKGFTTVELISSFILVSIIVLFLFQIVFALKDLYVNSGVKLKLVTKQSTINAMINKDLQEKKLIMLNKLSSSQVRFYFKDGTNKDLIFSRADKIITYGDYATELAPGSTFGNISIKTSVNAAVSDSSTLNGILSINIPVYHTLLPREDFGVNIIYLYNSNTTALSGISLVDVVDAEKTIQLIPSEIAFKGLTYKDPGYYVVNSTSGALEYNSPDVVITGGVDTSKLGTYYITYTLYDMNKTVMDTVTRTVNVVESETIYNYVEGEQVFNPATYGLYKVELYGASGGGTTEMAGHGGYTSAIVELNTTDELKIFVGGAGKLANEGVSVNGGYNGGGKSGSSNDGIYSGSGGGATDVRLNSSDYSNVLLVAGGGGGAGSKNDSVAKCYGGAGGGLTGTKGACSADSYLGGAGTQTTGGAAASYTSGMTTLPTSGITGVGGNGGTYTSDSTTYGAGGGGGGYFGGGGGARYGGGGGGSGFCSLNSLVSDCTLKTGTELFQTTDGIRYETGHYGDGFVKITLMTILTTSEEE